MYNTNKPGTGSLLVFQVLLVFYSVSLFNTLLYSSPSPRIDGTGEN